MLSVQETQSWAHGAVTQTIHPESTAAQLRFLAICCKLCQQMSRSNCSAAVAGPTVSWLQVVCRLHLDWSKEHCRPVTALKHRAAKQTHALQPAFEEAPRSGHPALCCRAGALKALCQLAAGLVPCKQMWAAHALLCGSSTLQMVTRAHSEAVYAAADPDCVVRCLSLHQ